MAEEKEIIRLEIDDSQASRKVAELTAEIQQMTQARKEARKEGTATAEQEAYWQRTLKESRQELGAYQKVLNEQRGSMKRLKAETALMIRERDKLNTETKEGARRFDELTKAINRNDAAIRKSDQQIGNFRANVGNYAGGIKSAFNDIGGNIMKMFGPQALIAGAVMATVNILQNAVGAAKRLVTDGIKLADIQLKAEAKLRAAVKGNADEFERFTKLASDRQRVTLFGDEDTIEALAYSRAITQNADATERLMPLIQDLATAKNIDLNRAAEMVSKSFAAGTSNLKQYGVEAVGAAGSTERLDSIVNGLTKGFGKYAETVAKEGLGPTIQFQGVLNDAKEEIGKGLIPVMNYFSEQAMTFMPDIEMGFRGIGQSVADVINYFIDLYNEAFVFRALVQLIANNFRVLGNVINLVVKQAGNSINTFLRFSSNVLSGNFKAARDDAKNFIKGTAENIKGFGEDTFNTIKKGFDNIVLREPLKRIEKEVEIAGKTTGSKYTEAFINAMKDDIEDDGKDAGKSLGDKIADGVAESIREKFGIEVFDPVEGGEIGSADNIAAPIEGALRNVNAAFDEYNAALKQDEIDEAAILAKRRENWGRFSDVSSSALRGLASVLSEFADATENNEKRQRRLRKAAGVFEIKSNLIREVSGIWRNSTQLGIFGTIWAGIQTGFATARALAGIAQLKSLHTGGWTGSGFMPDPNVSGHNIAGVVHQNEYVIPERMTMNPAFHGMINTLERYRTGKISGFVGGGATSGIPAMTTINQSGGISPGELRRALEGMNVYVKVTDINEAQGTRARVMNGATI